MLKNIIHALKKYQRFAIVSHIKMDGDAIGSVLGLTHILREIGKQVQPITQGAFPDNLNEVPGADALIDITSGWPYSWVPEVLICLDSASRARVELALEDQILKTIPLIINIDHHLSNESYGSEGYNWIDCNASSTGEMLVELSKEGYFPINLNAAICFYTAILTDTGNFIYSNVSPKTLVIASDLLKIGVKPGEIVDRVYQSKDCNWLRLEARVLDRVQAIDDLLLYSYVSQQDFLETATDVKDSGALVALLTKVKKWQIVIMFIEIAPGIIKLSLRGKGYHNLAELAAHWGDGGGHARAAGTTIKGGMSTVINEVLSYIKPLCSTSLPRLF